MSLLILLGGEEPTTDIGWFDLFALNQGWTNAGPSIEGWKDLIALNQGWYGGLTTPAAPSDIFAPMLHNIDAGFGLNQLQSIESGLHL